MNLKIGNALLHNNEARSRNHCSHGKAISITNYHCVSSISYPACKGHAPYYIILSPVARYDYHIFQLISLCHNFLHYLRNGTIFGNKLLNTKCVFRFSVQLLSETYLILRRIQRDIIINLHTSSRKYPLLLSDFNKT